MMLVDEKLYAIQAWKKSLNTMFDRPESSTRAVAHHVNVSRQTVCRVLNEKIAYTSSIFIKYKLRIQQTIFTDCKWVVQQCAL
ncbi:hypothetical protein TNCV_2846951 [Trichonephila clavipes]|nr:hypothetical protein TNCV_2846951 [Trichonephila clavipes]